MQPAKHEAGHYVVGKALGFTVKGISVTVIGETGAYSGGSGVQLHQPLMKVGVAGVIDYLERRIQVLVAGAFAESVIKGKVDYKLANANLLERGAVDYAKLRELLHIISNMSTSRKQSEQVVQKNLEIISDKLCDKSIAIVERNHETIKLIAEELSSKVNVLNVKYTLEEYELQRLSALVK